MLPEFLATIVATLIPLLIGAIVVCTLASITDTILRLRCRNLRRDLAQFLLLVHKAKIQSGESDKQIHARCRRDAARILRTPDGSRPTWIHPDLLQHVVVREMNFGPEFAPEISQKFSGRGPAMRKRYALIMRLWVIARAFLLSLVYLVFLPATGNAPLEKSRPASDEPGNTGGKSGRKRVRTLTENVGSGRMNPAPSAEVPYRDEQETFEGQAPERESHRASIDNLRALHGSIHAHAERCVGGLVREIPAQTGSHPVAQSF